MNAAGAKTPLEWLLLVWTALNLAIGAAVLAPLLLDARVYATPPLLVALALVAAAVVAGAVLVWKLWRPTPTVLLFGLVFWALQIFSIKSPDAIYQFRLGLTMTFWLSTSPDFSISINVFGVMLALLFAVALRDRRDAQRSGY